MRLNHEASVRFRRVTLTDTVTPKSPWEQLAEWLLCFYTFAYILWACQVICLCCTADSAEDSEMQGRRPQPLYKLQEALRLTNCQSSPRGCHLSMLLHDPQMSGEADLRRFDKNNTKSAFFHFTCNSPNVTFALFPRTITLWLYAHSKLPCNQ